MPVIVRLYVPLFAGLLVRIVSTEEPDPDTDAQRPPRQLAISLDRPMLNGMTPADRNAAVRRLARLLMEATGVDPEEIGDDER